MKSLTFPRVASDQHPLADGSRMSSLLTPLKVPDETDYKFADEILKLHSTIGSSSATGEWKWVNDHKKQNYIDAL
jgi:hypothetical protein